MRKFQRKMIENFVIILTLSLSLKALNSFYEVNLLGRYSSKNRTKLIDIDQIDVSKNPIHLFKQIGNMIKGKNEKYLVISISPFTFLAILLLKIFGKKFIYI